MTGESRLYLQKRAQQERDLAAARQGEPRIADAHREAADEYERHADGIDSVEKRRPPAVEKVPSSSE